MGTQLNAFLPGELWLFGLVALAAMAYVFDYTQAVKSTQALTLISAVMLGQGAGLWESRNRAGGTVVGVLMVLLLGAAVWQAEAGQFFQFRGQGWWAGPWDNPNAFGMRMGVGLVLAPGLLVQSPRS
jgi:hypothetical protein